MKRFATVAAGLSLLLLAGTRPAAAQAKPWIHVQVEEAKGSKVHVNVPLSLLEIAMSAAPQRVFDDKHIRINGRHDLKIADMRRMWAELKAAGETEFVRVQDEDDDGVVTVSRKGDLVQVRVEGGRKSEQVMVDVPVSLVDALFSGEGEELNIKAAIGELSKRRGDIVRVQDAKDTVRVWIDEGK